MPQCSEIFLYMHQHIRGYDICACKQIHTNIPEHNINEENAMYLQEGELCALSFVYISGAPQDNISDI